MASSSLAIRGSEDSVCAHFCCAICQNFVYKPTVLACGHVYCFWCLHLSMNQDKTSKCLLCMEQYDHLPRPCSLLHHLLVKIAPKNYNRRSEEVEDLEKTEYGTFSSKIPDGLSSERSYTGSSMSEKSPKQVVQADVLCGHCNELLCQPIVLNCGHVFCKSCRIKECVVCDSPHFEILPKVCLFLDQFLAEQFPNEYNSRVNRLHEAESASSCAMDADHERVVRLSRNHHPGVGCDSCGMYPIEGRRYRCQDCKEPGGYDLCKSCHDQNMHLPGRFDQNHTSDHIFVVDGTTLFRD